MKNGSLRPYSRVVDISTIYMRVCVCSFGAKSSSSSASTSQYDIFLSHDWSIDQEGRNNHYRVAKINRMLKERGFVTWFDEDRMTGDIVMQMTKGIENSRVVIVFITKNYLEKVASDNPNDNCKVEFRHARKQRTTDNMISVVMENAVKDTSQWQGPVGMYLGEHLYVNMTSDDKLESGIDDLVKELNHRGVVPT